ncbi:MAG: ribbon-helix-helix protein, CopG family [Nitrococcus sp.]|nr:ribbon-helix-helix protein, CopG family [Nitrococcus sp.]
MTVRSTYALDEQTAQRIRELAQAWGVSQAEVIRRSVRQASELQAGTTPSPAEVVARYMQGPLPRNRRETQRAIRFLRDLRHRDDERRA